MTREEKQLLIKDLYARLPYEVLCKTEAGMKIIVSISKNNVLLVDYGFKYNLGDVKPYLRSLLTMTEEEKEEYCNLQTIFLCSSQYPVTDAYKLFDWLNAHHFDYRGLIERGLALEAPEGIYES